MPQSLTSVTEQKKNLFWFILGALILFILAANTGLAMQTIRQLAQAQSSLTNTSDVINRLKDLHQTVLLAESGQRGYLLTEDDSYLLHYDQALQELDYRIQQVSQIETEISGQRQRIDILLTTIKLKKAELVDTVTLAQQDQERAALRMIMTNRGRDLYRELSTLFQQTQAAELQLRDRLFERLRLSKKEATWQFFIFGGVSIALVIGMLVVALISIRRDTRHRIALQEQNDQLQTKVAERTAELQQYSDELSRSNQELEDFAFVASHDLQEPLRKIQAFGERLDSQFGEQLEERGQDYLSRMRKAAQRMSILISDLLEYSRVSTRGKDFEHVDPNLIVQSVLDDLEVALDETHAVLTVDSLPQLEADSNQMYQLFLNLISNSLKFRQPENAPNIRIEYQQVQDATHNEPCHQISVIDDGIGFDPQYAEKIFVPFQRLHGRTQYKGTGIGLAICRRIIERHGGTLTATSELNKGTTMTIQLPMKGMTTDA